MIQTSRDKRNDGRSTAIGRLAVLLGICLVGLTVFRWIIHFASPSNDLVPAQASRSVAASGPATALSIGLSTNVADLLKSEPAPMDASSVHAETEDQSRNGISAGSPDHPSDRWEPFEVDGLWGYRDGERVVIEPQFNFVDRFKNGIAVVEFDGEYYFIDSHGQPLSNNRFDIAWILDDGPLLVKVDGKYGYVDRRGEYLFPPIIEETFGFTEGMAVVRIDGLYGFIDQSGRILISPKYDYAWPFKGEEALVKVGEKHWFIGPRDNFIRDF